MRVETDKLKFLLRTMKFARKIEIIVSEINQIQLVTITSNVQ